MVSAHVALRCGIGVIEIDPSLADMALPRVHIPASSVGPGLQRFLRVDRVLAFLGAVELRALHFGKHPDSGHFIAEVHAPRS